VYFALEAQAAGDAGDVGPQYIMAAPAHFLLLSLQRANNSHTLCMCLRYICNAPLRASGISCNVFADADGKITFLRGKWIDWETIVLI